MRARAALLKGKNSTAFRSSALGSRSRSSVRLQHVILQCVRFSGNSQHKSPKSLSLIHIAAFLFFGEFHHFSVSLVPCFGLVLTLRRVAAAARAVGRKLVGLLSEAGLVEPKLADGRDRHLRPLLSHLLPFPWTVSQLELCQDRCLDLF